MVLTNKFCVPPLSIVIFTNNPPTPFSEGQSRRKPAQMNAHRGCRPNHRQLLPYIGDGLQGLRRGAEGYHRDAGRVDEGRVDGRRRLELLLEYGRHRGRRRRGRLRGRRRRRLFAGAALRQVHREAEDELLCASEKRASGG